MTKNNGGQSKKSVTSHNTAFTHQTGALGRRRGFEEAEPATNSLREFANARNDENHHKERGIYINLSIREISENDPLTISNAFKEQGWDKAMSQYERYINEQRSGERVTLIAEVDGEFAGYVNVIWESYYPAFKEKNIPEINDFNVLLKYRRLGIGSKLMDRAEEIISERSSIAGIGVGIFSDYGNAQVLYVKRGYVPDGKGIHNGEHYVTYGESVVIDDDIVLYLTKTLKN